MVSPVVKKMSIQPQPWRETGGQKTPESEMGELTNQTWVDPNPSTIPLMTGHGVCWRKTSAPQKTYQPPHQQVMPASSF